jgi:hypothetical protein
MNLVNIKKIFGAGLLILLASIGKLANNGKKAVKSTRSYLRSEKVLPRRNHFQILALKKGLNNAGESQESKNNQPISNKVRIGITKKIYRNENK